MSRHAKVSARTVARSSANPWDALAPDADDAAAPPSPTDWLEAMLRRNRQAAYLAAHGAPQTLAAFRQQVPLCRYEDLAPWIARMAQGQADVLFAGRPVGWERTGGSSGGAKLVPYSAAGLDDFRRNLLPWLWQALRAHGIRGRAYAAISPATRVPEQVGGVPVGLPDGAYLGQRAAAVLLAQSAVPWQAAQIGDVAAWRAYTLRHLRAAHDLEFISVWSPTFLLRLLDDLPDAAQHWPRLKLISCWADAAAAPHAQALAPLLPQARIQPKGLLCTEGVLTLPDAQGQPLLARHGFVEFLQDRALLLPTELQAGQQYEAVLTTASGLYRYRTGDLLRCDGHAAGGAPILRFAGRGGLCSDLVGEKLTEAFVAQCLAHSLGAQQPGLAVLLPDAARPGYVLVCENAPENGAMMALEQALCANPQYAYARRMGQLAALRLCVQPQAGARITARLLAQGTRLADIKPLALRPQPDWLPLMESTSA